MRSTVYHPDAVPATLRDALTACDGDSTRAALLLREAICEDDAPFGTPLALAALRLLESQEPDV